MRELGVGDRLTLNHELDDRFWHGSVVYQTIVFPAVDGSYGMKEEREIVGYEGDSVAVHPYRGTAGSVLENLCPVYSPLKYQNQRLLGDPWTRERYVASRFGVHRLQRYHR